LIFESGQAPTPAPSSRTRHPDRRSGRRCPPTRHGCV
jgi:hypothetical protein